LELGTIWPIRYVGWDTGAPELVVRGRVRSTGVDDRVGEGADALDGRFDGVARGEELRGTMPPRRPRGPRRDDVAGFERDARSDVGDEPGDGKSMWRVFDFCLSRR